MAVIHVLLAIEVPEEFDAAQVADIPADVASSYEGPGRPRVASAAALPELDATMEARAAWLDAQEDNKARHAAHAEYAKASRPLGAEGAELLARRMADGVSWRIES